MSQKSRLAISLVVVLTFAAVVEAQGRTWTDKSGRTTEGDFVRLDGDHVIIRRQGKEVPIPLDRLCDADQAYARSATPGAASGDPSDNPFEDNDAGKGKGKSDEDSDQEKETDRGGKYPLRNWRDKLGLSVRARFIAVVGQDIVLERNNGLRLNVPFYTLVENDQEYVEKELKKAGTAHLTPSRAAPQNGMANGQLQTPPRGQAPPGGYGPTVGGAAPQGSSPPGAYSSPPGGVGMGGYPPGGVPGGPPPGYSGPPGGVQSPKGGLTPPPGGYSTPPGGVGSPNSPPAIDPPGNSTPPGGYATPPNGAPPGGYASSPGGPPIGGYGSPPGGVPPGGYASPPSGAPPGGFGTAPASPPAGGYVAGGPSAVAPPVDRRPITSPMYPFGDSNREVVYTCSNCNREMPRGFSIKEGDQCPYCKIRFAYREEPNGKRHYSQMYTDRMTAWTGIGIALGSLVIIGIVIGVIVQAVRG
jgi:DNA-directed RNA polymerase subunit RPC12/RpoP